MVEDENSFERQIEWKTIEIANFSSLNKLRGLPKIVRTKALKLKNLKAEKKTFLIFVDIKLF